MGVFLLVTPGDMTEVPNASVVFNGYDIGALTQMIDGNDWGNLSQILEGAGLIGENVQISNARVINAGTEPEDLRFWYTLA